tara:strand:+ start:2311 stop:3282 length:972 start_codon:yes stop_codon:yes gene_type:complete
MYISKTLKALFTITTYSFLLFGCISDDTSIPSATPEPTIVLRKLRASVTTQPTNVVITTSPNLVSVKPTPTPYTYTVMQGDTLISIASKQGVTVDQIQVSNSGIDPLSLQPGQELIIPFDDVILSNQNSLIEFESLQISDIKCYQKAIDGQYCLGEVQNNSLVPIMNLSIQMSTILQNEQSGSSKIVSSPLPLIMPGEKSPISATFAQNDILKIEATIATADNASKLSQKYHKLEMTTNTDQEYQKNRQYIETTITNSTESKLNYIVIVTYCYDNNNFLQSYNIVRQNKTIDIKQTSTITTYCLIPTDQKPHYVSSAYGKTDE